MKLKSFFIAPIRGYQYLSKMLPASCRYYPSCSEYAKEQFEFNRPDLAFFQSSKRILKCNKLFEGGIDYPVVRYTKPSLLLLSREIIKITYWIVQKEKKNFYIIKGF